MTQTMELSNRGFKITMINVLRVLMEKTACKNRRALQAEMEMQKTKLRENVKILKYTHIT